MSMQIINSLNDCENIKSSSVALGTFDGLHRGHRIVIALATGEAKRLNAASVVIAVNRSNYQNDQTALKIMTESQKEKLLKNMGVDYLVNLNLQDIKAITAEEFFNDILIKRLNAKHIACGYNCRFGKDAKGDVSLLEELCKSSKIDYSVASPVLYGNTPISSTEIRGALASGNIKAANSMLGRPFCFDFTVVDGDKLGRKLGAPTINQPFPKDFVLPKFGVYAATVRINDVLYPAVTNVGVRPTIGFTRARAESYILDYSGDLYGRQIEVSLLKFLRDEQKFDGIEALKTAIKADAERAAEIFKNEGEALLK